MSEYGFVYVVDNICMPGICKIGMTTHPPHKRIAELSSSSGVPDEFCLVMYAEVRNPQSVEAALHRTLSACRVNHSREFFRLSNPTLLALHAYLAEIGLSFVDHHGIDSRGVAPLTVDCARQAHG